MEPEEGGDALLAAVRRELAITWESPETDMRLRCDIIPDAQASLKERLGLPDGYAFDKAGRERRLLLALCFYIWNAAEDEFWENYRGELLAVNAKWRANEYAEEEKASAGLS